MVAGGGGVAAIHGDDVGVGRVGAELADVVVTGGDMAEGVGGGGAVWVEACGFDEVLAEGVRVVLGEGGCGGCGRVEGGPVGAGAGVGVVGGAAPFLVAVEGGGVEGVLVCGGGDGGLVGGVLEVVGRGGVGEEACVLGSEEGEVGGCRWLGRRHFWRGRRGVLARWAGAGEGGGAE